MKLKKYRYFTTIIKAVYIRPAAGHVLCRYSSGINIDLNPSLNNAYTHVDHVCKY